MSDRVVARPQGGTFDPSRRALEGPRPGRRAPRPDHRLHRPELPADRPRQPTVRPGWPISTASSTARTASASGRSSPGGRPGTSSSARSAFMFPRRSSWPWGPSPWPSAAGRRCPSPTPRRCSRATCARWSSRPWAWPCPTPAPTVPLEDLAVGETTCDAKKKTWDVLSKGGDFHVLELPQKKGPGDRALWLEEVVQFRPGSRS